MSVSNPAIEQVLHLKHGPTERMCWSPRLRRRFGYHTPDDGFEALLFDLIDRGETADTGRKEGLLGTPV